MYVDQSVPRRSRRPWRVEEYQPYRVEPPQPPAAVVGMVAGLRFLERVAGLSYSFYTPYVQCSYIMSARLRSRSPWFGAEVDGVVFFWVPCTQVGVSCVRQLALQFDACMQ